MTGFFFVGIAIFICRILSCFHGYNSSSCRMRSAPHFQQYSHLHSGNHHNHHHRSRRKSPVQEYSEPYETEGFGYVKDFVDSASDMVYKGSKKWTPIAVKRTATSGFSENVRNLLYLVIAIIVLIVILKYVW